MSKFKNAPHFKDQDKSAFELLVLAGANSWNAWNKGNGQEWLFLCDVIKENYSTKPIILGDTQLKEINQLRLANDNTQSIKIFIFGELSEQQKTAICLNIAKNTKVQILVFFNSIGEIIENSSQYLDRLRNDSNEIEELIVTKTNSEKSINLNFNEKPTQNKIAEAFISWTKKPLGFDLNENELFEFNGIYWELLSSYCLQRKVKDFYDELGGDYTANKLKSIAELVNLKAPPLPSPNKDFIGFKNGVLNKKTGDFLPHHISHNIRYIEKFNCNTDTKETPVFDKWLKFVSNGNEDKKRAMLAGLYMILTNRHEWSLFLEATGVAGSGKSVFSKIASIINGNANTAYISLQELEIDKKRAMLIGKSFAISPDQKPYKGNADELKAITGGDDITVKINYVNDFSVRLTPVFMLVTNYPLYFTDRNEGIARRRVIVPFDRPIPKDEKDVYFIEKVQIEVYGIVNKLLALFPNPEDAREILEQYRDLNEGLEIKKEANHLIDFVGHFTLTEKRGGNCLRIGSNRSQQLGYNGHESLYSAYLFFCDCHNIKPLNVFTFKKDLPSAFKEAGEKTPYTEKTYNGFPTSNAIWKNKDLSIRQWEG